MKSKSIKKYLLATTLFVGMSGGVWHSALAQEAGEPADEEVVTTTEAETADEARQETVTVVGSLLKRNEYTSIAPVQIIAADVSRAQGLVDASSILQNTSVSAGQQIDASFAGFVLDNGPGATTVDLRGLGAGRTLVLVNGRRLAPAGVEGAPSSPDLSLVPGGLVESYDLLLDGASSIYGSDAVAGVVNATLRRDFDGFEVDLFRSQPQQTGGEETQINLTWGASNDRGFIGFGAEYYQRDTIALSDRDFSSQCERNLEITEDGEIRSIDLGLEIDQPGMGQSPCDYFPLARRMSILSDNAAARPYQFGSVYYTPGSTNIGLPNFSESALFGAVVDGNGDGLSDFSFYDYSTNGAFEDRDQDMLSGVETISLFSYGEYTLDGLNDATAYFEASYAKRESRLKTGLAQLFPTVPANNPFNPCNIDAGGSDCGVLFNDAITGIFGAPLSAFGLIDAAEGVNLPVQPIVTVRGDRDNVDVDIAQFRLVGGLKGELPFTMPLLNTTWDYDVYGSFSRSDGSSVRRGIRDDRLQLSLLTTIEDPSNPGQFICGLDANGDGIPDPNSTPGGCVPVNLFAPSLYETPIGDFATQAERDYLFGVRSFNTIYEQSVINGVISGDLFKLPGGMSSAALGFEYRQDMIDSRPDDVAANGLFYGFFSDQGASGSKDLYEAFVEVELPLIANQPLAYELTTNLSARWTEEQYYGAAWTYSGKIGYRPVEWMQFSGTIGTSFRAPNVREQFLRGQTGFLTLSDPCVVPEAALGDILNGGTYDPSLDPRDARTLANCAAAGIDPTSFAPNGAGNSNFSVEIQSGGGTQLSEETSESWTAGITIEQPWFDAFDLSFRATYYDILIEGAIAEPGAQFIINDCYSIQDSFPSSFCSRIQRNATNGALELVVATPINVNTETAKGVDLSVNYDQDVTMFGRNVGLGANVAFNHKLERDITQLDDNGEATVTELVGRIAFPEWTGSATFFATLDDWRASWSTRYIGEGQQPDSDPFSNYLDGGSVTCLGASEGDVDCRDVDFVDSWMSHDLSLGYVGETFDVSVGVRNIFDELPPFVDPSEYTTNGANVPLGAGYTAGLFGRTFFVSVGKRF